jgi:hypothetical protein
LGILGLERRGTAAHRRRTAGGTRQARQRDAGRDQHRIGDQNRRGRNKRRLRPNGRQDRHHGGLRRAGRRKRLERRCDRKADRVERLGEAFGIQQGEAAHGGDAVHHPRSEAGVEFLIPGAVGDVTGDDEEIGPQQFVAHFAFLGLGRHPVEDIGQGVVAERPADRIDHDRPVGGRIAASRRGRDGLGE